MRGNTIDHGQCIIEETLTDYLEGALDPAVKAATEAHLIVCDACRTRLAFFMRLLSEDVSEDEDRTLQAIENKWEGGKFPENPLVRTGARKRWFLGITAVAAIVLIGLVSLRFVLNRPAEPKSAGEVVQALLAQHRPFESRLAGEPHLPITRTRGRDEPGVSYGVLAGEMIRLSADAHQMGRFYLLQKDFERAIRNLETAEREPGAGAGVHNDLGVAYLESGVASRMPKAAAEFQHALEMDPAFAPAVFNLALFYERTGAPGQAASQWKRYLSLDSQSPWAGEVNSRLQGLSR